MKAIDRKLFGTDGIRGKANIYPMTSEVALYLGRAVAYKARERSERPKIIVGKDTRLSCYMIEMALVSGICSMGADALMTGPIPTPGIAYLTKDMRCDAGIVITASHNPYWDNGIKIFGPDGFKLSDEQELELEQHILGHYSADHLISTDDKSYPKEDKVGKAYKIEDARGRYISHLKQAFPQSLDLCGMRIAIDCANGACYKIAPLVFRELGAEVTVIGDKPNGTNINHECGALHTNRLELLINMEYENTRRPQGVAQYDIGFAFDGDGDRLVVIDEKGRKVNGDSVLAMAACVSECNSPNMVITKMSNFALHESLKSAGGTVVVADVGDRYVIDEMRKTGIQIGGEDSGHIIFMNHSTTGDGILAALKILEYIRRERKGEMVSDIANIIKPYPRCFLNMDVKNKRPIEEMQVLKETIDRAKSVVGETGKVLVRYSGTENVLRILVEHKDEKIANDWAKEIKIVAEAYLT